MGEVEPVRLGGAQYNLTVTATGNNWDEDTVCSAKWANVGLLLGGLQWPATTADVTAACQAAAGQRLSLFVDSTSGDVVSFDSLQSGNDDPYSECSVSVQSRRRAEVAGAFTGAELKQRWGLVVANHQLKDARHIADTADYAAASCRPQFVLPSKHPKSDEFVHHQVLDRLLRALHREFVATVPADNSISLSKFHALATARFRVADRPTDSADEDASALALLLDAPVSSSVAALDLSALAGAQPILQPPPVPPALDGLSADAVAMFVGMGTTPESSTAYDVPTIQSILGLPYIDLPTTQQPPRQQQQPLPPPLAADALPSDFFFL
ncbi:hypothetical protein H4R19_001496 [Coemansia spiralis]|nr:hypothetical protein H4R19_001496 [Coemansia spiralis]